LQDTTSTGAGICLALITALLRNKPQRFTMSAIARPALLRALIMVLCFVTATAAPCGTRTGDTAGAIAHGQQMYSWRSLLILAATAIMTIKAHVASTARAGPCACQHCQKNAACKDGHSRACSCSHCKTEQEKRRTREYFRRFHRKSDTSTECGCQHCQHKHRMTPTPTQTPSTWLEYTAHHNLGNKVTANNYTMHALPYYVPHQNPTTRSLLQVTLTPHSIPQTGGAT
jgi:hypothetical protein